MRVRLASMVSVGALAVMLMAGANPAEAIERDKRGTTEHYRELGIDTADLLHANGPESARKAAAEMFGTFLSKVGAFLKPVPSVPGHRVSHARLPKDLFDANGPKVARDAVKKAGAGRLFVGFLRQMVSPRSWFSSPRSGGPGSKNTHSNGIPKKIGRFSGHMY